VVIGWTSDEAAATNKPRRPSRERLDQDGPGSRRVSTSTRCRLATDAFEFGDGLLGKNKRRLNGGRVAHDADGDQYAAMLRSQFDGVVLRHSEAVEVIAVLRRVEPSDSRGRVSAAGSSTSSLAAVSVLGSLYGAYAPSKFAQIGLAKVEVESLAEGITVNTG